MQASDIIFLILCTALVMLMTPALALFYGGMVNKKNVLSTTMHSYVAIALISIQWIIVGYSLAFGGSFKGIIGGFDFFALKGVGAAANADYVATVPHQLFMLFQLMFAVITPALISGALAERMKFKAYVAFILLWSTFVYDPIAHWVWNIGGWLRALGALDFAGGNAVHISSGVSGLVAALVLGNRAKKSTSKPHNIPMIMLGAGLLWFGWFGFNAGSALTISGDNGALAVNAFLTTNTAAAAAAIVWLIIEKLVTNKPTAMGTVGGALAGLVAITPAAGFVSPMSSIIIGAGGGAVSFFGIYFLKKKLGYDDALDAFGCHGLAGTWGALATGIFASKAINPAGADGLIYGNVHLFVAQVISVIVTYAFAAVMTFIILKVIGLFTTLRVSEQEETEGLDVSLHGESAYE
jgi:Amt family ammonium transporter